MFFRHGRKPGNVPLRFRDVRAWRRHRNAPPPRGGGPAAAESRGGSSSRGYKRVNRIKRQGGEPTILLNFKKLIFYIKEGRSEKKRERG